MLISNCKIIVRYMDNLGVYRVVYIEPGIEINFKQFPFQKAQIEVCIFIKKCIVTFPSI